MPIFDQSISKECLSSDFQLTLRSATLSRQFSGNLHYARCNIGAHDLNRYRLGLSSPTVDLPSTLAIFSRFTPDPRLRWEVCETVDLWRARVIFEK